MVNQLLVIFQTLRVLLSSAFVEIIYRNSNEVKPKRSLDLQVWSTLVTSFFFFLGLVAEHDVC